MATEHYGVWYLKVILGLPDAAIAAQAGWSERAVTKMVATYAHTVDERRLDEIDQAFERDADRDASPAYKRKTVFHFSPMPVGATATFPAGGRVLGRR